MKTHFAGQAGLELSASLLPQSVDRDHRPKSSRAQTRVYLIEEISGWRFAVVFRTRLAIIEMTGRSRTFKAVVLAG